MIYILRCRLTSRLICSVVTCFVLFGGWNAAAGNPHSKGQTQVGRPFKLMAGRQVTLKGERLRIKFAALEGDSRCPKNVTCVWAGNAAVRLEVSTRGSSSTSVTLNTAGTSSLAGEQEYHGYKVRLLELKPYPQSAQKIAAGDYTVTLLVSKARANPKVKTSLK